MRADWECQHVSGIYSHETRRCNQESGYGRRWRPKAGKWGGMGQKTKNSKARGKPGKVGVAQARQSIYSRKRDWAIVSDAVIGQVKGQLGTNWHWTENVKATSDFGKSTSDGVLEEKA